MRARVTFHRKVYEGEMLYVFDYPNYERDEKGAVKSVRPHPQRVGLMIDGVSTHFTVPERVVVGV